MSSFLSEDIIDMESLDPVYENENEKVLEDGSILYPFSGEYSRDYLRVYSSGQKREYHLNYGGELLLIKEELPDGLVTIYGYQETNDDDEDEDFKKVIIYQKDASGNYVYNRYEKDDYAYLEEFIETHKGNIKDIQSIKEGMSFDDIEFVYENENGKFLEDGSVFSTIWEDEDYLCVHPDGKKQTYHLNDDGDLLLTKEELPDGSITIYGYATADEDEDEDFKKVIVYQKDASGNYVYNRYEENDGCYVEDFIETQKGNIKDVQSIENGMSFDDLEFVYENADEKVLEDGAVLTTIEEDEDYLCTYPNGKKQTYHLNDNGNLILTKEELPDGSVTVYGYQETDEDEDEDFKKVIIYQKDALGNYVYNRYEENDGCYVVDFIETQKGNIKDLQSIKDGMSFDDLEFVYENEHEKIFEDGSILTTIEEDKEYLCTYPNGKKQSYYLDDDGTLVLTKEELPDGSMLIYDYQETDDEVKKVVVYQKDAFGNYVYNKYASYHRYEDDYDDGSCVLTVIEGNVNGWTKKTYYDENQNPVFYEKDGDENKKYYLSGVLKEEIKDDGSKFAYYDNGQLKSEEHADGRRKEYSPTGFCLFEEDNNGNYQKFKLNRFQNDVLLIEKADKYGICESYEFDAQDQLISKKQRTPKGMLIQQYYPGSEQKIKEERAPNGTITRFSPTGKKTYEKRADGSYTEFIGGRDYKRFDRKGNLIEEANVFGKTTYTYYPNTKQIEHIHKYNESGLENLGAYKHYDKEGHDNTKYYLARKKLIKERLDKEDEKALKRGVERIKTVKKVGKIKKLIEHIQASRQVDSR